MPLPENNGSAFQMTAADIRIISTALAKLERVIAAVHRPGEMHSEFDRVLDVLNDLSHKEGIPIAIVGGMAAIKYGFQRLTHDVDMVIAQQHLDTIVRVAPRYSIKIIWQDPKGWHKLEYEGVRIEVVPEGAKPSKDAPKTIPGPGALGIAEGLGYASIEGWIETKLGSGRAFDRGDVVQVLKKTTPTTIAKIREHISKVHSLYLRLFDELVTAAEEEKQQEAERGGPR